MAKYKEVIPCRYCGTRIRFFRNSVTGKKNPVNEFPVVYDGSQAGGIVVDGNYVIFTRNLTIGERIYVPHWYDPRCPNNKLGKETKTAPLSGKDFAAGALADR